VRPTAILPCVPVSNEELIVEDSAGGPGCLSRHAVHCARQVRAVGEDLHVHGQMGAVGGKGHAPHIQSQVSDLLSLSATHPDLPNLRASGAGREEIDG
jgi:hypothetical protein